MIHHSSNWLNGENNHSPEILKTIPSMKTSNKLIVLNMGRILCCIGSCVSLNECFRHTRVIRTCLIDTCTVGPHN